MSLKLDFENCSINETVSPSTKKVTTKRTSKKLTKPMFRRFAFTSFSALDFDDYEALFENEDGIKYLVVGLEECPKTKKQHIQGYISYNRPIRCLTLKSKLPDITSHIEGCKGDEQSNIDYCTKDNNYKEYGTKNTPGKRTDIATKLKTYTKLSDFILNEPDTYIRYRSGIEGYYRHKGIDNVISDHKPKVIWLYGDTGTGKSRSVRDYLKLRTTDGSRVWRRPLGSASWFDGYSTQNLVFLDELRGSTYKFDDLLQMLDYDCPQVPIKGGFTDFNPEMILITSNSHPRETYLHINDENKEQLVRRIDHILHIKKYKQDLLKDYLATHS